MQFDTLSVNANFNYKISKATNIFRGFFAKKKITAIDHFLFFFTLEYQIVTENIAHIKTVIYRNEKLENEWI